MWVHWWLRWHKKGCCQHPKSDCNRNGGCSSFCQCGRGKN